MLRTEAMDRRRGPEVFGFLLIAKSLILSLLYKRRERAWFPGPYFPPPGVGGVFWRGAPKRYV
jgi:hypothetical protein